MPGKHSKLLVKALGMPLYPENGKGIVDKCLRAVILWAILYDGDSGTGLSDGLVVGTVHC